MARTDDPPTNVIYRLLPGAGDVEALHDLLAAYRRMFGILAEIRERNGLRANVVELTRLAYDRVRAETGLPSRFVTLGIRDYAQHLDVAPEALTTIPLDEKLYAIKGPSELSVTTLDGRRTFAYRVEGYGPAAHEVSPARLIIAGDILTMHAGVAVPATTGEVQTMTESIRTRIGRLMAGFSNAAIDAIEGRDPLMVAEEALREIDRVINEIRDEVGKFESERYRADQRRQQLEREASELGTKIATALSQNRDDLARAGVARQMDIETQVATLAETIVDLDAQVETARGGLEAALATRRDAEMRVKTLRSPKAAGNSIAGYDQGPATKAGREHKLEGSLRAIDRVTGLPGLKGSAEIEDLENLHRQSEIDRRLAELKQGRPS